MIIASHSTRPDWIRYGEKMASSPLDVPALIEHRRMWRQLHKAHPQLSWSQKQGEEIMAKVANHCSNTWARPLAASEINDYCDRMSKRLRTMAKHIMATKCKRPKCGWLARILPVDELLGVQKKPAAAAAAQKPAEASAPVEAEHAAESNGEDEEAGEEEEPEEEEDLAEEPEDEGEETEDEPETQKKPAAAPAVHVAAEYFYGFDHEFRKAWRQKTDGCGTVGKREYSTDMKLPEGAEHPVAFFPGSSTAVTIKKITAAEYCTIAVNKPRDPAGYWHGDAPDGTKLRITRRYIISILPLELCSLSSAMGGFNFRGEGGKAACLESLRKEA